MLTEGGREGGEERRERRGEERGGRAVCAERGGGGREGYSRRLSSPLLIPPDGCFWGLAESRAEVFKVASAKVGLRRAWARRAGTPQVEWFGSGGQRLPIGHSAP